MDTGGGDRLLDLRQHWPALVVATEAHPPNRALAWRRLAPLGVSIVAAADSDNAPLPFTRGPSISFSTGMVVSTRARLAVLCARALPSSLSRSTGSQRPACSSALAGAVVARCDASALPPRPSSGQASRERVEKWTGQLAFSDIGGIVYLAAVPELVPGFSVATHRNSLDGFRQRLECGQALSFSTRGYVIEAVTDG